MPPTTDSIYPFEFVVGGTAVSLQSSSRSRLRWQALVAGAAQRQLAAIEDVAWLDGRMLAVTILHFPRERMIGDLDNIVKPILDALVGVAYHDDAQIERITVQRFEPDGAWDISPDTTALTDAITTDRPVTYVRIDDDLRWRTMP